MTRRLVAPDVVHLVRAFPCLRAAAEALDVGRRTLADLDGWAAPRGAATCYAAAFVRWVAGDVDSFPMRDALRAWSADERATVAAWFAGVRPSVLADAADRTTLATLASSAIRTGVAPSLGAPCEVRPG